MSRPTAPATRATARPRATATTTWASTARGPDQSGSAARRTAPAPWASAAPTAATASHPTTYVPPSTAVPSAACPGGSERHHGAMAPATLVLASASPARLSLLRAAGIEPTVIVSDVDEDAITAEIGTAEPEVLVAALARAKAEAVAARLEPPTASTPTAVLGCDSLFTIDGTTWGKPSGPDDAVARIRSMREREGVLHTGHHLIDARDGRFVHSVASTTVRFGPMTDGEVDAYVATGEPLRVAGSFTLDGRSAPWIDGVVGDHTNVVGLSLPTLRTLLGRLEISIVDLWD